MIAKFLMVTVISAAITIPIFYMTNFILELIVGVFLFAPSVSLSGMSSSALDVTTGITQFFIILLTFVITIAGFFVVWARMWQMN